MPTTTIPTVKRAESRIRLFQGTLKVYRQEQECLNSLYSSGQLSKKELEESLTDVVADIATIEKELQAAQIIHRTTSAA